MPIRLRKKLWIIPPFLYLNASNSGLSWTLKIGPWSRNSRTKRQRVDLPGPISWVGRTKGQRAAARKRREARRAQRAGRQQQRTDEWAEQATERLLKAEQRRQERGRWDAYFRDKERPAGAPQELPAPERQGKQRRGAPRAGTGTVPPQGQSTASGAQSCTYCGAPIVDGRCSRCSRAPGELRRAGLCGQRTQDGSACMKKGPCPSGYHHPRRR